MKEKWWCFHRQAGGVKRGLLQQWHSHTSECFIGNTLTSAVRLTAILSWRLSAEGLCKEQASSLEVER